MKRILFLLSLVLIPLLSYAQSSDYDIPRLWNYNASFNNAPFVCRHQVGVYVSAGNAVTEMYWQDKINELYKVGMYDEDSSCGLPLHFVGWGVEYYFNRDSRWKFGVSGGREFAFQEMTGGYVVSETNKLYHKYYVDAELWYVIPTVRYDWLKRSHLKFYSSASVGLARIRYEHKNKVFGTLASYLFDELIIGDQIGETEKWTDHSTVCAYQAVPFGCELGNRWFNYFIEFGYGYKGKIITGIRYSF